MPVGMLKLASAQDVPAGYEEADKLLLLIQGSGRVRVGVWGCALCINKNLDQGTMLPYIKRALQEGYASQTNRTHSPPPVPVQM